MNKCVDLELKFLYNWAKIYTINLSSGFWLWCRPRNLPEYVVAFPKAGVLKKGSFSIFLVPWLHHKRSFSIFHVPGLYQPFAVTVAGAQTLTLHLNSIATCSFYECVCVCVGVCMRV